MDRGVAELSPGRQVIVERRISAAARRLQEALARDLDASHADYAATIATRKGRAPRIPCKRGSVARHLLPRDRAWPDRREGAAQILRGTLFRYTRD